MNCVSHWVNPRKKVEELREKRKTTKETTEKIKLEIKELQERKVPIPEDSACDLTKMTLKGRNFYRYLDGSSFIAEALFDHVKKTPLPAEQAEMVERLESELHTLRANNPVETPEMRQIKSNLEEIMTTTNPFYSQYFIQSVNVPFIRKSDELEIQSWKF